MPKAWKHHKDKAEYLTMFWFKFEDDTPKNVVSVSFYLKKSLGILSKSHLETPNGHLVTKCPNESKLHNKYMYINSRTALPTKTHNKKLFLNSICSADSFGHLVTRSPNGIFEKKTPTFSWNKTFFGGKNLQKLHLYGISFQEKLWKSHLDILFQENSRNPFKKAI